MIRNSLMLLWKSRPNVVCRATSEFVSIPSRPHEKESVKRSRLFYQSRKRGTLENGILLSSFTNKYLKDMTTKQLTQFDNLINNAESDWQLYYWITGREHPPSEYDCEVLHMLQKHCQNQNYAQNQLPHITPNVIYH